MIFPHEDLYETEVAAILATRPTDEREQENARLRRELRIIRQEYAMLRAAISTHQFLHAISEPRAFARLRREGRV